MTTSDSRLHWQDDSAQTGKQSGNSAEVPKAPIAPVASDLTEYRVVLDAYMSTRTAIGGAERKPKETSNWLQGEFSRLLNATNIEIKDTKVRPEHLVELLALIDNGTLSNKMAKEVLEEMFRSGKMPSQVVKEKGLAQISTANELEMIVVQVIAANAPAVADFKQGKEQALKFLVGQVMKATKGQANPQMLNELLRRMLANGSQ